MSVSGNNARLCAVNTGEIPAANPSSTNHAISGITVPTAILGGRCAPAPSTTFLRRLF